MIYHNIIRGGERGDSTSTEAGDHTTMQSLDICDTMCINHGLSLSIGLNQLFCLWINSKGHMEKDDIWCQTKRCKAGGCMFTSQLKICTFCLMYVCMSLFVLG